MKLCYLILQDPLKPVQQGPPGDPVSAALHAPCLIACSPSQSASRNSCSWVVSVVPLGSPKELDGALPGSSSLWVTLTPTGPSVFQTTAWDCHLSLSRSGQGQLTLL